MNREIGEPKSKGHGTQILADQASHHGDMASTLSEVRASCRRARADTVFEDSLWLPP